MNKNSAYYVFVGALVGFYVAFILMLIIMFTMQVNRVCTKYTELAKLGCGEFDVKTGEFVFTGSDANQESNQTTE